MSNPVNPYDSVEAEDLLGELGESINQDRLGRREATRQLLDQLAVVAKNNRLNAQRDTDDELVTISATNTKRYATVVRDRETGDFRIISASGREASVTLRYNLAKQMFEGEVINDTVRPPQRRSALATLSFWVVRAIREQI